MSRLRAPVNRNRPIGLLGDGHPKWQAASGNLHADEATHRDATYYSCGC